MPQPRLEPRLRLRLHTSTMEIRFTWFAERLETFLSKHLTSPPRRAFSFLEQPFFRRRHRLRCAEHHHDIAFFQKRFRCRFDGADATAANGADFAAELLEVELIEGAPDGYGAVAEQHGVQARLVMIVDFVEVVVAGATVEAA